MIINTFTWLYILFALVGILLFFMFKRIAKVHVWIKSAPKPGSPMVELGYLEMNQDGTAGEVHLSGGGSRAPLGRIITNSESKRDIGLVEIITSDIEDETEKPHYCQCGYINFDNSTMVDEYGYIYKHVKGQREKELVGYCARPSDPNTPTIYGERSWKTLWLVCTLNAYLGAPQNQKKLESSQNNEKQEKKVEKLIGIGNDVSDENADKSDTESSEKVTESVSNNNNNQNPITDDSVVSAKEETTANEEVFGNETDDEELVDEVSNDKPVTENENTAMLTAKSQDNITEDEKKELDTIKKQSYSLLQQLVSNMIPVEGGSFVMGADQDTQEIEDNKGTVEMNESPKHNVTLDDYYIGKYPVTQEEWSFVMGNNPSEYQDSTKYPVAPVTWNDCLRFLERLSYLTGTTFSLPTEAQWEYAARGGKSSKGYIFSGSNDFSEVGHRDYRHDVGTKKPNELGLYDMSGLVREWCSDLWGKYSNEDQTNPIGPTEDSPLIVKDTDDNYMRVVRSPAGNETVTNRKGENPELNKEFKSYGFRVVCLSIPDEFKKAKNEEEEKANDIIPVLEQKDKKSKKKQPAAVCQFYGFHSSKNDILPAEARACAYALLSRSFQRRKYVEYYKDHPYGWRDTALLTTFIYSGLFLILYIFNTGVLHMPLLGDDIWAVTILIGAYYVLWALVRLIKIDCIENSNSFQPKLDLFNKNLGVKWMNYTIVTFASIAMYFTLVYYDYDLMPLIWAIGFGVSVNMTLVGANRPWYISTTYNDAETEDNEEDDDESDVKNPPGDIMRNYEWDLDAKYSSRKIHGSLTLFFTAREMSDVRHCNPFFAQRKDKSDKEDIFEMFNFLQEHKPFLARVRYIAHYISTTINKQSLPPLDKIQFTLDFVQEPNIQFVNNKDCKVINYYDEYIRYPDETLYDKEGDCNSKSLLAAMIFHVMGYNVLYLVSGRYQHAAIGIEVKYKDIVEGWYGSTQKVENLTIQYNGKYYIYCETTGDRFSVGKRLDGMQLEDFEEKLLLPSVNANEDFVEDESDATVSRIYNWDLDSEEGVKLHGNITLNFSTKEMDNLRDSNPFNTYEKDSNSYQTNIRSIFKYLLDNPKRMEKVRTIATYIRNEIEKANYSEFDMLQFALDFAQAPNITYCIDENSVGIDYAKEYMRFPDEVLYDKEGDCDCKSSLTAALFHELGYNVIIMLSQKIGHAAIGVECKEEWLDNIESEKQEKVIRKYRGKNYLYCETTGDGYKIGNIKENDSIQDYETIVEIPV